MKASISVEVIAGIVLAAIAAMGILMVTFPHQANRRRMRLRGQTEASDSYVRALGAVFAAFAITCEVLLIVFAA